MPRKLKVFIINLDGRNDGLVAAPNKKEAARLFGTSLHSLNQYGSEMSQSSTNHTIMNRIRLALSEPGTVWVRRMYNTNGAMNLNFEGEWTRK